MTDLSKYVGIPFVDHGRDRRGVDCWGLVRLVYAEEFRIVLPSYTEVYASLEERDEIAAALDRGLKRRPWLGVTDPRPGDVLWYRLGRHACHVGLHAGRGRMLHAHSDQSKIVSMADPLFRNRFLGACRHEARP